MSCVYLLSITPPFEGKRHYVGYSKHPTPHPRLRQHHRNRKLSTFTGRVQAAGCKLALVMFWSGANADEVFERFIKDDLNKKDWCPHCGHNTVSPPTLDDRPNQSRGELVKMMADRKKQRNKDRDLIKGRSELRQMRRLGFSL